jgi:signal peptidase I
MPYHELHRGDIAVFVSPAEPGLYLVKRIVAVPGDHLHLREGKVYVNGVEQREPYVKHTGNFDPQRDNFPEFGPAGMSEVVAWPDVLRKNMQGDDLVIPSDSYFAMGDNRENSYDSRYWGFVPKANVMGSPLFIAWSLNQDESDFEAKGLGERVTSFLSTAVHFFAITRWNRVLRLVH